MYRGKTAVVLMTALVPTTGHAALIEFAIDMAENVTVILSSRSFEPISGDVRRQAIECHFFEHYDDPYSPLKIFHHKDDNAPQNPSTDEEWNYWKGLCEEVVDQKIDYVISSEAYGTKMAELLGAIHIPFDIDRRVVQISGTMVRKNPGLYFDYILPEFKEHLLTKITLFGQESVGKSSVAKEFKKYHLVEWARPFLEAQKDKSITPDNMEIIARGQYVYQKMAYRNARHHVIVQDTDLLSTIGYYRLSGLSMPVWLSHAFEETKSDHYIVFRDNIPFVPDPLRYGGDKRESTMQFWIDLLEEFGCSYQILESDHFLFKTKEVMDAVRKVSSEKLASISSFKR